MARSFPERFLWGSSTAAYQIEGAAGEDGRGTSIWDKLAHTPGKIVGDDTGTVACDHYHRYPADVALMVRLNLKAYRFSTAWPRIQASGRGAVNRRGLEFYDRLVDRVMASGLEPWLCLYHWDLPQALEERGGWQSRDVAFRYADYAQHVVRRLGDRVAHIATFNEPNVAALAGYGTGEHAPGLRGRTAALKAIHHMSLAHGLGLQALRAERAGLTLGNIYNLDPIEPIGDGMGDREAAKLADALWNRAAPDVQILGRYPELIADEIGALASEGDLANIHQPLDFIGVTYAGRRWVRRDGDQPFAIAPVAAPDGRPVTATGVEIVPDGFRVALGQVKERYGDLPIYVTANGAAFGDRVEGDDRIRDVKRIDYLHDHLGAVLDAIAAGVPVKGYFVWSLLDGFEWDHGYSKGFGLVHVDRATLDRRPKDSFDAYAEWAGSNALD